MFETQYIYTLLVVSSLTSKENTRIDIVDFKIQKIQKNNMYKNKMEVIAMDEKCPCQREQVAGGFDIDQIKPLLQSTFDHKRSLITILQKTQSVYGYLPKPVLKYISDETKIPPSKIYGVATFYTQFRLTPVGKNLIMLCQGTACHVNGSALIEKAIEEALGIADGQTTPDGVFTFNNVACLGCCSLAPVMMINGETYAKLTPTKTKNILNDILKERAIESESKVSQAVGGKS